MNFARLRLFCKDMGGTCVLTAKPYDCNDILLGTVTVTIPLDVDNNGIADAWERDKIVEHNGVYPGAPLTWSPSLFADTGGDDEPAALGNRRTDGSYSHADTGDGLTVFQEYRGYEVDGGAGFTSTRHVRLSPALKELLVQVNKQDNMAMDVGTGSAANPSAFAAFDKIQTMQAVAQFYCHPTRGAGIDLYWVNRPFVPLVSPAIMGRSNAYRYTGDMVYAPKPGTSVLGDLNGSTWISGDGTYKYGRSVEEYQSVFPSAKGSYHLMLEQNRDSILLLRQVSFVICGIADLGVSKIGDHTVG